jgi:hypothetical protein
MNLLLLLQHDFLIIIINLKLIIVITHCNVLVMSKKMYDSTYGPRAPNDLLGVAMVVYNASLFSTKTLIILIFNWQKCCIPWPHYVRVGDHQG